MLRGNLMASPIRVTGVVVRSVRWQEVPGSRLSKRLPGEADQHCIANQQEQTATDRRSKSIVLCFAGTARIQIKVSNCSRYLFIRKRFHIPLPFVSFLHETFPKTSH